MTCTGIHRLYWKQRKLHPCCENYFVLIHRLICVIAASCNPKRFMIAVHDSMATIQWLVVLESLINLQNTSSHDHLTNNLKVDNGAFNHQGILSRQQQIKRGCPSQEQSSDRRRPAWLTGTGSGAMHGRCFVLLACTINQHWSQIFWGRFNNSFARVGSNPRWWWDVSVDYEKGGKDSFSSILMWEMTGMGTIWDYIMNGAHLLKNPTQCFE